MAKLPPIAAKPIAAAPPPPQPPPQEAVPFQLNTSAATSAATAVRRARRKSSALPWAIVGLSLLLVVAAGGAAGYVLLNQSADTLADASGSPTASPSDSAAAPANSASAQSAAPPASNRPFLTASNNVASDDDRPFAFEPAVETADGGVPSSDEPAGSGLPPDAAMPPAPAAAGDSFRPAELTAEEQFEESIVELYKAGKLLTKKEYPTLRKLMADRFARHHAEAIRQGLGEDYDEMMAWFAEHPDIRDELFTAIDPEADKIPAVLSLFNDLRKAFPKKIGPYSNLAIATAVVWDDQRGIYRHDYGARATKATMPTATADAIDNFRYLVEAENFMQGRILYVPWEFLIYVVNHTTSLDERAWAMRNYLPRRAMFGKCYSEVPYDYEMLDSNNERTRLAGKEYNLPNILVFGGVCMIQADYAARVGKSLGVPAVSVGGRGAFGGSHAWVMWAELKQATPTGLVFSLESHGRYRNDNYYVGNLSDPQTGARITDRDMELRLQTVGADTVACRHAKLAMQVFPIVRDKASLDTNQQLALLSQTIQYCPGCEDAWFAVAQIARESKGQKQYAKSFDAVGTSLFTTFARVPDFTWKVFDDLAAYPDDSKKRRELYQRLIVMYETAKRPDLATEARLKLTDYLLEENQKAQAIDGLALSIRKFPAEGQLVPRLLDRLEELAADMPDADRRLAQFYTEFLPLIPQKRGDRPSEYCIQMYERAIGLFQRTGQPQLVLTLQVQLAKIQAPRN